MKKTATAEEVIPAVFPATPENRYLALLLLKGEEIPLRIEEQPLLLSMGEACELLGVSRATLWRMIRAGRLAKVEIYPNAFRLKRADVIALANGKAVSRG